MIHATGAARPGRFAFAPFDLHLLHDDYHRRFVELIAPAADAFAPRRVLEIGSSTGRTFYELARRWPALEHVTLVEPSRNLRGIFTKIFDAPPPVPHVPVVKGLGQVVEVRMDTTAIRATCAPIARRTYGVPFAELPPDLGEFDLVICSNVIDQWPRAAAVARAAAPGDRAPGGRLAHSCTYQWQAKHRGLPAAPIRHLDEVMPDRWPRVRRSRPTFSTARSTNGTG